MSSTSLRNRISKVEIKHGITGVKTMPRTFVVTYCDDESREEAINKVCKEKNISIKDAGNLWMVHSISVEYASRQKALGNWPLKEANI
jgi:hypothetical protein